MFKLIKRTKKVLVFLIIFLFLIFLLSQKYSWRKPEFEYGVTFSKKQAVSLGLDWQKLYLSIFDELGVKKIRLAAYWDEIEPKQDNYYFNDLDWQIEEAAKREVEIVLAIGGRLPRWPECHFPEWAKGLSDKERQQEILGYIEDTVKRYMDNSQITIWQVENEPFLSNFGDCPDIDKEFLDKEIALVRELDDRDIMITDSGELSLWVPAAKRADIFGTTMYRDTYSKVLKSYVHYPIEPGFFRFKKNVTNFFANPQKWVVIEMQAEPWGPMPFQFLSDEERGKTMDLDKFREMIEFSKKTGFREFYLWGVEWWYWEKEVNNNSDIWEQAKFLFIK